MLDGDIKDKIFKNSLKLFVQKGKENTTLADIAKESKIEEEVLSKYYNNTNEILTEVFEKHFEHILTAFEPRKIYDDIDEYFEDVIETCKFSLYEIDIYSLYSDFFAENIQKEDFLNDLMMIFESGAQVFVMQLEHFQTLGVVKEDIDVRATARGLITVIDGMMYHRGLFKINGEFYDKMLTEILKNIVNGIKVNPK